MDEHAHLTAMLDFCKCMPPLENLIGGCNQEGETRAFIERITAKMMAEGAFTYPWVLLMHMNG